MRDLLKNKLNSIDSNYFMIIIVSLLLSSPLFVDGLFRGHDLDIHIYRFIGTVNALLDLQFPPLLAPDFSGGFGYAWNIFYGPLSAYIPAIIKIFIPTFIGSFKIFIFLTILFSGITMYHFVKDYSKSPIVGVLAAVLYMTAPYRLVDIYIRGAAGEVLAFVFIPILFQGLFNLFHDNQNKAYLITIGGAGLVLTHNISALICVIFSIMYLLFNITKVNLRTFRYLIINGIFIVGITLFFVVPLLEQKFLGNYLVFMPGKMGSIAFLEQHALYIHQLIFGLFQQGGSSPLNDISNEMPFMIGLQVLLPILITPVFVNKVKKQKCNYLIFLGFGLFAAFATTNLFPWGSMPEFFSFIQFPWRLLMMTIFFLSIISAQNIVFLFEKIDCKYIYVIIMVIMMYISPLLSITAFDPTITDLNYSSTAITKENLEFSRDRASNEYLPEKTYKDMDYFLYRSQEIIVKSGDIKIGDEKRKGSKIKFRYSSTSDTVVELPFLYYVGWNVSFHQSSKQPAIQVFETDKGFVGLKIPGKTSGVICVEFTGSNLAKTSFILSIITGILFIIYVYFNKLKKVRFGI